MRSSADLALWLLSAAFGVLGIFMLLTLGVPGLVLVLIPLSIFWLRSGARRSLRAGGALAGLGGGMLPNVTVTSVTAAVILVLGLALTFRAWRLGRA